MQEIFKIKYDNKGGNDFQLLSFLLILVLIILRETCYSSLDASLSGYQLIIIFGNQCSCYVNVSVLPKSNPVYAIAKKR